MACKLVLLAATCILAASALTVQEATSSVAKLKDDLTSHRTSLAAAQKAMAEATAVRNGEKDTFQAEADEKNEFIASLIKAISALKSGIDGKTGLIQSRTSLQAATVSSLGKAAGQDEQLTDDDRASLMSFLTAGDSAQQSAEYSPISGEVMGIMQNMKDDYAKDLAAITATENEAATIFEDLIAAKTREVKSLKSTIAKKTQRVGALSVEIVEKKADKHQSEEDPLPPACYKIKCADVACAAPFELRRAPGQCCSVCYASEEDVALDRHTAMSGPNIYARKVHTEAPATCAGVKCFKPTCHRGEKPGYVDGRCCQSCVGGR